MEVEETMNGGETTEEVPLLPRRKLITWAVGMLGIQFCWAIQVGYVTKGLLQLGLPSQFVSIAWLAGPITGVVMQPTVGWYSDRCQSPYGKRRPFIVGGAIVSILSLLLYGFAESIGAFLGDGDRKIRGIMVAVAGFWLLDFSLNGAQGPLRTLLVDIAPPEQQVAGNTYLAFMTALGNFLGGIVGSFELGALLPIFPNDIAALFTVGALVIGITTTVCAVGTKERPQVLNGAERLLSIDNPALSSNHDRTGLEKEELFSLVDACRHAPPGYWKLYTINCFTWFAWFCLFIYGTSWVGADVMNGDPIAVIGSKDRELYDEGVRLGNFGFSLQSLVALGYSILLRYNINRVGKTLPYLLSQWTQALCLLTTMFTRKARGAIAMFGMLGICWSTSMAVPWSFVGEMTGKTSLSNAGMYMTIFNSSQCFPEIIVSLLAQLIIVSFQSQTAVLVTGGAVSLMGAILLCIIGPSLEQPHRV